MTIFLSSASPLEASHSSLVIFEFIDLESLTRFSKTSFSIWLKNNYKLGGPGRVFQLDLGQNAGSSEKYSEVSFWKFHLIRILRTKSSISFRSSGSLRYLWTGEKSNPFSKTWIAISDNALWQRLKTVLEQNVPARRPSSVMVGFVGKASDLTTELPIAKSYLESSFCKSTRIESSSSSNLLTKFFYSVLLYVYSLLLLLFVFASLLATYIYVSIYLNLH